MKKGILITLFLAVNWLVNAQADTIVMHDYTKVMINVDKDGAITPATTLESSRQAGFFLNGRPDGQLKICNDNETSIWADGRLIKSLEHGCAFLSPQDFMNTTGKDTVFVSIYSSHGLDALTCQLVTFEELLVIKEDPKVSRNVRDAFNEFTITVILLLLLGVGVFMIRNPSRMAYILEKSFTFKISSYEFVNTNFISVASMQLVVLLSFLSSFYAIYFDQLLNLGFITGQGTFVGFLLTWVKFGGAIFGFLMLKWMLISAVAKLFHFREINNYQLFDFVNFSFFLFIPITLFTLLDFVLNRQEYSWTPSGFQYLFPVILGLFILWFSFKFVNNSPRRKLLIISYLCATEIIPAIIFFGWFYK